MVERARGARSAGKMRTGDLFEALQTVPDRGGTHDVDVGGFAVGFLGWGCLLELFDCEHAGRVLGFWRSGWVRVQVGVRRHRLGCSW